jgi:hypothetical protein
LSCEGGKGVATTFLARSTTARSGFVCSTNLRISFISLGGALMFSISISSLLGAANACDEKIDMLHDSNKDKMITSFRKEDPLVL